MLAERRRKEPGPFLEGSVCVQPWGMAVAAAQLYRVPRTPGACAPRETPEREGCSYFTEEIQIAVVLGEAPLRAALRANMSEVSMLKEESDLRVHGCVL